MNRVIARLINSKMTRVLKPVNPSKRNFVIVCEYGDWSGFRTLAECESQYKELEKSGRPNGFYWVEER